MEAREWMESVNKDLENLPHILQESAHWSKRSIHRIPAYMTAINSTAYTPYIVSIGPYHHGSDNTKPMEYHKRRALLRFLERSKKPIGALWKALVDFAQDLKDAYDELSPEWHYNTDKFLQVMIVDGCFLLEILRLPTITSYYAPDDPVFSRHGELYVVPYLKRDMLMLENQLPLLVLRQLLNVEKDESHSDCKVLTRQILKFFHQYAPSKFMPAINHCHILDIYRKSLLINDPRRKKVGPSCGHIRDHNDDIILSATELVAGGIAIKMSESRSLRDISFTYVDSVLRLPHIVVDETMESVYLNQMAFERLHIGAGSEVTSFVFFMNNVIGSSSDVSVLQRCGVIQNAIGSEEGVLKLFRSLAKDATLDPESSLDEVHRQVSAYCKKPWSQWRAEIVRTYFTDPWAITAAAILLFVLTTLQTIFSVLAYVNPP